MHFTQPITRCSIWAWMSKVTLFPVLIILEHSMSLMNGFTTKAVALPILRNLDGRKVSVVPSVDIVRKNRLRRSEDSFSVENVNVKLPLLRGLCFIELINHSEYGFLLYGL